jgi:Putative MetA-pathway of phenol degradation
MRDPVKICWLWLCLFSPCVYAQLPFYTDDPGVTEKGKLHFEFFNEFDALQHPQYPSLRQNTANYKINFGLPHDLELDFDTPYLAIFRTLGTGNSMGIGDTNMGVKWNFHKESKDSPMPAISAVMYVEIPTGDSQNQLGSGLTDYWLYFAAQKSLSDKTRINANLGYLFAGNTSTGALGIQTARGHVYTGGISMLHDFSDRWTLGVEAFAGIASSGDLGKDQFQFMLGGQYKLREGLGLAFGLLGGKYIASPRIGAQVGFSVDFPDIIRRTKN